MHHYKALHAGLFCLYTPQQWLLFRHVRNLELFMIGIAQKFEEENFDEMIVGFIGKVLNFLTHFIVVQINYLEIIVLHRPSNLCGYIV